MPSAQSKIYKLQNQRFDDSVYSSLARTHRLGKIFYVDSNTGNSSYSGTRLSSPKATIAQAMAACTANQGDVIVVLPQHSETVTATITFKAGVRLTGLVEGNRRAVITVNGAIDLFDLAGAGSSIENLDLTIVTTDAATALINVSAAKCAIRNVNMIPSATSVNVVDCITLASGGDDVLIENVDCRNTTVAVNSFISIEAAVARMTMRDCFFFGDCATAGAIDGATATQLRWKNVTIATIGTTIPAVTFDNNPTGLMEDCFFAGTSTTLADNFNPGNKLRLKNCYVLEETDGSKQGVLSPAADSD